MGVRTFSLFMSLSLGLMLSNCDTEVHRDNDPDDLYFAQQVADSFYLNIINQRRERNVNLFSGEITPDEAAANFIMLDSALGTLVSYNLTSAITKIVVKNNHENGTYEIEGQCEYSRGNTREILTIVIRDSTYYISDYQVDKIVSD
jgi:hypothetical protein